MVRVFQIFVGITFRGADAIGCQNGCFFCHILERVAGGSNPSVKIYVAIFLLN